MKTIWKFELDITDGQEITMPSLNAPIIAVQAQNDKICLWAVVNPEFKQPQIRKIFIVGTGNPFPDVQSFRYLDTVQTHDGRAVWHVFEEV